VGCQIDVSAFRRLHGRLREADKSLSSLRIDDKAYRDAPALEAAVAEILAQPRAPQHRRTTSSSSSSSVGSGAGGIIGGGNIGGVGGGTGGWGSGSGPSEHVLDAAHLVSIKRDFDADGECEWVAMTYGGDDSRFNGGERERERERDRGGDLEGKDGGDQGGGIERGGADGRLSVAAEGGNLERDLATGGALRILLEQVRRADDMAWLYVRIDVSLEGDDANKHNDIDVRRGTDIGGILDQVRGNRRHQRRPQNKHVLVCFHESGRQWGDEGGDGSGGGSGSGSGSHGGGEDVSGNGRGSGGDSSGCGGGGGDNGGDGKSWRAPSHRRRLSIVAPRLKLQHGSHIKKVFHNHKFIDAHALERLTAEGLRAGLIYEVDVIRIRVLHLGGVYPTSSSSTSSSSSSSSLSSSSSSSSSTNTVVTVSLTSNVGDVKQAVSRSLGSSTNGIASHEQRIFVLTNSGGEDGGDGGGGGKDGMDGATSFSSTPFLKRKHYVELTDDAEPIRNTVVDLDHVVCLSQQTLADMGGVQGLNELDQVSGTRGRLQRMQELRTASRSTISTPSSRGSRGGEQREQTRGRAALAAPAALAALAQRVGEVAMGGCDDGAAADVVMDDAAEVVGEEAGGAARPAVVPSSAAASEVVPMSTATTTTTQKGHPAGPPAPPPPMAPPLTLPVAHGGVGGVGGGVLPPPPPPPPCLPPPAAPTRNALNTSTETKKGEKGENGGGMSSIAAAAAKRAARMARKRPAAENTEGAGGLGAAMGGNQEREAQRQKEQHDNIREVTDQLTRDYPGANRCCESMLSMVDWSIDRLVDYTFITR
jgi:hypothetical protein